ncbi:hypothetical protein KXD40_004871 [Peronospora effusa]|uniref:Uncharacterized protein n=2 Tax=Peronospora TaxID=70742 RepID=A0A3M6V786_9STRA|nr:hypothetical protein DD238_007525 [Peronospora effusa]CAH0490458.1 unnamed protein product [Peronospora farinosa]RQM16198.1 hypothetical protein DD237_006781 [Peronospora effusa]UIZ22275.1 hypothetical protein KXD40_004871 [Peronospora effusa]CAI5708670.1 unnamed protein product [Peronospora effusa]
MDFFKQAAEIYNGSSSTEHKKQSDKESLLTKAMEAAEKYHAKEKAAEFAQKRVAKRNVDQKDKSPVDKAVEAAEDFLAKQGQPKSHHTDEKKDNQMGDILAKVKEVATNYSKKH